MNTRTVEYFRLWDDHTWDTDFIDIPANTPEDRLGRTQYEKLRYQLNGTATFLSSPASTTLAMMNREN